MELLSFELWKIWVLLVYGLNSSAGNQDFGLFGAVCTQLSSTKPHSTYTKKIQSDDVIAPVLVRPATQNTSTTPTEIYIQLGALGSPALRQAVDCIDKTIDPSRVMIITLLPSLETSRGIELDAISLQDYLLAKLPDFK